MSFQASSSFSAAQFQLLFFFLLVVISRSSGSTLASERRSSMPSCAGACLPRMLSTHTGWSETWEGRASGSSGDALDFIFYRATPNTRFCQKLSFCFQKKRGLPVIVRHSFGPFNLLFTAWLLVRARFPQTHKVLYFTWCTGAAAAAILQLLLLLQSCYYSFFHFSIWNPCDSKRFSGFSFKYFFPL